MGVSTHGASTPGPHHLAPVRGLHSPLSTNPRLSASQFSPARSACSAPSILGARLAPGANGGYPRVQGALPSPGLPVPKHRCSLGGESSQVQVKPQHSPPSLAASGLWPIGAGWAGSPGTGTGTSPGTGRLTHTGRGPRCLPSSHLCLSHWRAGSHWALARGRATEAHLEGLGTDSKWQKQGRCLCTPSPLLGKKRGRTNPHTLTLTQQGQGC